MSDNSSHRFVFTQNSGWNPSDDMLQRISALYALASRRYVQPDGSMWGVIAERKVAIHAALMAHDTSALRKLFCNPANTELYYGMDTLAQHASSDLQAGGDLCGLVERDVLETLATTAEVSGAARFWNFDTCPTRNAIDADGAIRDIGDSIGIELKFPNPFPGEYGLETDVGVIGHRAPTALYHALKIRDLALLLRCTAILEIGAGMGRTAYFAYSMGMRDYTIVDLPMSLVGQAVFLCASLGDDAVWMEGEEGEGRGKIRLVSPECLFAMQPFAHIVMNIDSFTEMPLEDSAQYFRFAAKSAKALYSMNHELNPHRVIDIARYAGIDIRPIRSSSTLRKGYAEDLYLFLDAPHDPILADPTPSAALVAAE